MNISFGQLSIPSGILILLITFSNRLEAQAPDPPMVRSVALHAGAAYTRLADNEFEVVRSLAGQDLFSEVTAREDRAEVVAFVSQRLSTSQSRAARVYASLGTDLRHPGSALYMGGSLGFSRTFVTLGASTALVDNGIGPVLDDVFRGSGDRSLFAALDRTRKWGFFVSLSFGVIQ